MPGISVYVKLQWYLTENKTIRTLDWSLPRREHVSPLKSLLWVCLKVTNLPPDIDEAEFAPPPSPAIIKQNLEPLVYRRRCKKSFKLCLFLEQKIFLNTTFHLLLFSHLFQRLKQKHLFVPSPFQRVSSAWSQEKRLSFQHAIFSTVSGVDTDSPVMTKIRKTKAFTVTQNPPLHLTSTFPHCSPQNSPTISCNADNLGQPFQTVTCVQISLGSC